MIYSELADLNRGSDIQRDAYLALIELDVMSVLAEHDPMLAGELPLGIAVEGKELDIICGVADLGEFVLQVEANYGDQDEFEVQRVDRHGVPSVECRFRFRSFAVEIVGQEKPVEEQNAYRQMIAEAALLRAGGQDALDAIQGLRSEGTATLPAFGEYFCLEGEPAEALVALADADADAVEEVVLRARYIRRGHMPVEPSPA